MRLMLLYWHAHGGAHMTAFLVYAGMNMLNISVDTLRPERFEQMTRRRGHERVMDAIHNAIRLGYDPVKVGRLSAVQRLGHMQASGCPGAFVVLCRLKSMLGGIAAASAVSSHCCSLPDHEACSAPKAAETPAGICISGSPECQRVG